MQVLRNPNFYASDFGVLKEKKRQHFLVESEKVSVLARRTFIDNLFHESPYGTIAKLEDFDRITVEDCKNFHRTYILNGSLKIFVSGHLTSEVSSKLRVMAESWSGKGLSAPVVTFDQAPNETIEVQKEDAMQKGIRMGKRMIQRGHPDFPELQVLVTALGGYFGSRLMMNIREDKGYTYGIGAGLASYDHTGMFYIATEVGSDYAADTQVQITKEIELLQNELIPQHELALVKNYMKGSLARSADGAFAMMERFKTVYNSGLGLDYYESYLDKIGTVTSERLRDLACEYLQENSMLKVIAG